MSLMSGSTTYASLVSKYDDFMVPACKIKVGSTQIIGTTDVYLVDLEVTLSLDYAGSAKFTLFGNYDHEKSAFPSSLSSTLALGSVVEISLGYGSTVTTVFKGFIASVDMSIDAEEGLFFDILAFDARRLMQTDNRPYVLHSNENYSDIVKSIMSRYSALCSITCDSSSDKLDMPVAQRVSDYDFIMDTIIGEGNLPYEFFIVADEAYFRKKSSESAMLTLDMQSGLKSFRSSSLYLNREIVVQGFLHGSSEAITATVVAKNSSQKDVITKGSTYIVAEDCDRASKATEIANSYKAMLESKSLLSAGSTVGIPEIVPGRYIAIKNIDSAINQSYYVSKVVHRFHDEGFSTEFSTKG